MSTTGRIKMSKESAKKLKRLLNLQLRGLGHCIVVPTANGWDISVQVPAPRMPSSTDAPGMASVVEEHNNYLVVRPIGVAFDDATQDFPIKKPRNLRVETYNNKQIVDREGGVDLATSTGPSSRTLTAIDDDTDTEDQVVIPAYIAAQTITIENVATNFIGSVVEYALGAADDVITDDAGNVMDGVKYEDLNRWAARAFGEDNGS